jgi:hypothetical protein
MQSVYIDTSVFCGVFDKEFDNPSRLFFQKVHEGVLSKQYKFLQKGDYHGFGTQASGSVPQTKDSFFRVGIRRIACRCCHDIQVRHDRQLEFQAYCQLPKDTII